MNDMPSEAALLLVLSKAACAPAPVCPECGGSGVDRSGGGLGERCPSCRHGRRAVRRFTEYRACASDGGDTTPDVGQWRERYSQAVDDTEGFRDADPPFDDVWIESREVALTEPVRQTTFVTAPLGQKADRDARA